MRFGEEMGLQSYSTMKSEIINFKIAHIITFAVIESIISERSWTWIRKSVALKFGWSIDNNATYCILKTEKKNKLIAHKSESINPSNE